MSAVARVEVLPVGQLTLFDLAEIANTEHQLVCRAALDMVDHAIRAGHALTKAKEALPHGDWLEWLAANFQGSRQTADNYRRLAANCQRVGNLNELSLRKALELIAGSKEDRQPRVLPDAPLLPAGEFSVLYCDPPWRYEHASTPNRAVELHYPTMALAEIKALEVPAADDAILFLWATSPKLAESVEVIGAWEFDYRTCMVWVKDRIGMGYYARQQHELLLIARRGDMPLPSETTLPPSVIHAPRLEHSAKPEEFYTLIERMYPGYERVELFARMKRAGWESWGNEVEAAA